MRQPREAVSGAGCAEVARGLGMRREQGAVVVGGWGVWVSMWAVYIIYIVIMLYYSIGLHKITKYFLVKNHLENEYFQDSQTRGLLTFKIKLSTKII